MTADWRHHAACSSEDVPDIFFPASDTGPSSKYITAEAKAVCQRCPVTDHCLTWALEHGITDGIWGGLTARERRHPHRRVTSSQHHH